MADPIAQLRQIIDEKRRDNPAVTDAELVAWVESAISNSPALAAELRANPSMLQVNRDGAKGFQTYAGDGATVFIEGTHYHLAEPEKFKATEAKTFDFRCYLQSILDNENYQEWQALYIPLRVERVKLKEEHKGGGRENPEQREQVEQWDVLAGLRHYAPDHVLLMGKPGSGKSTALRQLLWEEAQNALAAIERGETNFKIPVLIELRDRKEEEIVNRIHKVLRQARLDVAAIEELLLEGRFLLLFDGLNEIPTPAIWSELQDFQGERDFRKNPRIFTTRELGAEAELGLEIKLTLLPLTEPQMRAFIENRLPGRAEILLHQLKERLRELAETPLLLKILCDVVKESPEEHLPTNRGELFRQEFARRYQAFKPKRGYVSEDSRRLTEWLLQQLAFEMTQGHSPTDPELQISKDRAIQILQNFLQTQGETNALTKASEYLEDLLEWDLLQVASDTTQIEFRHQLIQEYYAAEYLLRLLPGLSDEELKRDYLNYLKWTEPIALMLGLSTAKGKEVENETDKEKKRALALQLVKLALEVDWQLGARLAGEVRQEFQDQTVALVNALEIPQWLKVELLGKTSSEAAVRGLAKGPEHSDSDVYGRAAEELGKIGSDNALEALLRALDNQDFDVRSKAVAALGEIGSEHATEGLSRQ